MDDKIITMMLTMIVALGWGISAHAAKCPNAIRDTKFRAVFPWKDARGELTTLRIRLGSAGRAAHAGAWVAEIASKEGGCQAVCRAREFRRENMARAILEMECRSAGLGELTVPVTLIRRNGDRDFSTIRFGTWLSGYREAALRHANRRPY